MNLLLQVLLCVTVFGDLSSSQGEDGKSDENRPYKFGFNIEGYQHRYEEKNEKGIIMGEYGFITGDGVYHLTVYATDENGNFKIVRTKNVYIGLPGEKTTTPVPAVSSLRPEKVSEITEKAVKMVQGIAGCGGCVIPTTAAPQIDVRVGVEPIRGESPAPGKVDRVLQAEGAAGSTQRPGYQIQQTPGPNQPGISKPNPETPGIQYRQGNSPSVQQYQSKPQEQNPVDQVMAGIPKMTAEVQNMEDLQALFYIFNYTLTYHGHHETGNRAGDKNGSYFFNGRDGLGRNVTYLANEFGYQPNITLYDLTEDQTPNELTEKEKTQLLGNEFKWFYGKSDNSVQNYL